MMEVTAALLAFDNLKTEVTGTSKVLVPNCMWNCIPDDFNMTVTNSTLQPFNPMTLNGHYSGHTAPLTSRCCILNISSTNIRTEYFKHAA
jgi:hypothetical protein